MPRRATPLPFPRPRCPQCHRVMNLGHGAWEHAGYPEYGVLYSFRCPGRKADASLPCGQPDLHFDMAGCARQFPRRLSLPFTPPTCACGQLVFLQRAFTHPKYGELFRMRCSQYRKGTAEEHLHVVLNQQGETVQLSHHHYRAHIPFRPACAVCGYLMVTVHLREAEQNRGFLSFLCTQPACAHRGKRVNFTLAGEPVQRRRERYKPLPFAPRPPCPTCARPLSLNGRLRDLYRLYCQQCRGQHFYYTAQGEAVLVHSGPKPKTLSFARPHCAGCGQPMRLSRSRSVYIEKEIYRFQCRRSHCAQPSMVVLNEDGQPLPPDRRLKPLPFARPRCACGMLLSSNGEFQSLEEATLYRLACRNRQCQKPALRYYTANGELRVTLTRTRRLRRHQVVSVGRVPTAHACAIEGCPHLTTDGKFCHGCRARFTDYQLWRGQAGHAARERWRKVLQQGIRVLRRRLGLTQKALASALGISEPLVSLLEQGKRRLTPLLRQKLLELAMKS